MEVYKKSRPCPKCGMCGGTDIARNVVIERTCSNCLHKWQERALDAPTFDDCVKTAAERMKYAWEKVNWDGFPSIMRHYYAPQFPPPRTATEAQIYRANELQKITTLEWRVKDLERERSEYMHERSRLNKILHEEREVSGTLRIEIGDLGDLLRAEKKKCNEITTEHWKVVGQLKDLQAANELLQAAVVKAAEDDGLVAPLSAYNDLKKQLHELQLKYDVSVEQVRAEVKQHWKMDNEIKDLKDQVQAARSHKMEAESQLKDLHNRHNKLACEYNQRIDELKAAEEDNARMTKLISSFLQLNRDLDKLRESLSNAPQILTPEVKHDTVK